MRHLYFDAEAGLKNPEESYEMLYDSIINFPGGYEGPAENRTISRVLDKLEKIGTPTRRNNQDVFGLSPDNVGDPLVALEDAEYDLVMKVMKGIRWTGTFARKAVSIFDWLETTPREPRSEKASKNSPAENGVEPGETIVPAN